MSRRIVSSGVGFVLLGVLLAPSMLSSQIFRQGAWVSQVGGQFLHSIIVADVNGDGYGDLLLANGGVGVALGHGGGTFDTVQTYISNVSFIAAADLNGDGKIDVVASGTTVRVLMGNGDGTFQSPVEIDPGNFEQVVLGDVNGDGKLDVVAISGSTIGVWLGNGDGTFGLGQYSSPTGGAAQIAIGDVNGDGLADLLVINSAGAGVLLSNGDGTFQAVQNYGTGGEGPIAIAAADITGDGKPDLIVLNKCSSTGNCATGILGVLAGNGDGTFQPAVSSSTLATQPHAMAVTQAYGVLVAECTTHVLRCGPRMPGRVGILRAGRVIGTGGLDADLVTIGNIKGYGDPDLVVGLGCCAVSVHFAADRVLVNQNIVSSPNPSVAGQAVTFTATLTATGPWANSVPTGYVRFMNGRHCLGRATINQRVATFTTTALPVGTLSITGKYVAQWPWQGTSTTITQVVNSP